MTPCHTWCSRVLGRVVHDQAGDNVWAVELYEMTCAFDNFVPGSPRVERSRFRVRA
jgi:hypothetical protein